MTDDLGDKVTAVARVRGVSVNAVVLEALEAAVAKVASDDAFTAAATRLLERDREIIKRLGR